MKISTSILDCKDRMGSVLKLNETNTSYIHIDVMDGQFVYNKQFLTIGEILEIQRVSKHPLDIHLMMKDPISYIKHLKNMNIEFITVHLEIDKDLHKIMEEIHEMGYKAGISLKPNTDINQLESYLKEIDLVLLMSVEPGMGGQSFLTTTVDKVSRLKKMLLDNQSSALIEVDGGINDETIQFLKEIDIAVVGSYIVKSDNYLKKIEELLKLVNFDSISIFFNMFIILGSILIFLSAFLEIGNSDIFYSLWKHSYIFLSGFFLLVIGLFNKSVLSDIKKKDIKILRKLNFFYRILLMLSIVATVLLVVYSFLFIDKFEFCWLFLSVTILNFWHIWLLILLFISVILVRLNEIKRLSQN